MKKIIALALLITVINSVFAQGGRIKIFFAGFDCYRETWDDILQSDGKGDEVSFKFSFLLADKNGASKLSYEKPTPVYGDATGPFSNRINVGSCVDLFGNKKGGIKGGDTYRCNDLIGEFDMAEGDIVTIIPTAWEQDPIADNSNAFMSTVKGFYNNLNQRIAPVMIGFNVLTGNLGAVIFHGATLGLSKIRAGGDQGELGKPGTRPIGMEKYGDFNAKLVLLNTPNLSIICNSDMGFGRGVIAVNYNEEEVGNLRDHGNYSILLRIEYSPNAVGSSPTTNMQPSVVSKTFAKQINDVAANPVAGMWKGTYGNGQNSTPNFYSFRFNTDGTMENLDNNGNAVAKGTYKFVNNQLSGFYIANGNVAYSFAATLNSTQLSGTWGNGTNTSGGGKWIMNKTGKSMVGNIR
jgi:hypothetical protein